MAKIYVAYRTDSDHQTIRIASGSYTVLKKRLREQGESVWTVATYNIKPDVRTLCQIIEDLSEIEADEAENLRVNAAGQVRKTD